MNISSSVKHTKTVKNIKSKLTDVDAAKIFRRKFEGRTSKTVGELAREYNITAISVYRIWSRNSWIAATRYVFKSTLCMP